MYIIYIDQSPPVRCVFMYVCMCIYICIYIYIYIYIYYTFIRMNGTVLCINWAFDRM